MLPAVFGLDRTLDAYHPSALVSATPSQPMVRRFIAGVDEARIALATRPV
ncbi:MAG: hypothetical protein QXS12_06885 [Candidatus Caldarchaeum sp.]